MDNFYEDVRVLDPNGEAILTNGTGNSDNHGNYWFEIFSRNSFPIEKKEYIITAITRNTKLPVKLILTCVRGNSTSSFRK